MDPFSSKRPGDEQEQGEREAIVHDVIKRGASGWRKEHPESEAAKDVSEWGVFAARDSHQRFLQEMWPALRGYIILEPKKK